MMPVTKYVRHNSVMRSFAMAITASLSESHDSIGFANTTNTAPSKKQIPVTYTVPIRRMLRMRFV